MGYLYPIWTQSKIIVFLTGQPDKIMNPVKLDSNSWKLLIIFKSKIKLYQSRTRTTLIVCLSIFSSSLTNGSLIYTYD